jgi:hypothetical protein
MQTKFHEGGMSHMIDNFFFISAKSSLNFKRDLNQFISMCSDIGVPMKHEENILPSTIITIYGIEIDSEPMKSRLPIDRIEKIKNELEIFTKKRKVFITELRSLLVLLNFATSVISVGRAFLSKLTDLTQASFL